MKKKSAVICLICVICVPWMLASCVKDELHDTPHPDKGVVSVSVDYPQGAEEDDYTVEVDGKPLDEGDNASNPLAPGEHTVLVYNTPEGFTVTDGIAYVERVDGTRALTDLIDPLPETLYSGTKTVTVVVDDTLHLDLSVVRGRHAPSGFVRGAADARPPLGTDRDRGRPGTHRKHYGHTLRRGGGLRPAE